MNVLQFEDKATGFQISIPTANATTYFDGNICRGALKQLTATVYLTWDTNPDNPGGLDEGKGTINRVGHDWIAWYTSMLQGNMGTRKFCPVYEPECKVYRYLMDEGVDCFSVQEMVCVNQGA